MNENRSNTKITVACPSGHRLWGSIDLAGSTVRCPKCREMFVFAPSKPAGGKKPSVTDTGVLRILGDHLNTSPHNATTMPATKPCSRCGVAVSDDAIVCNHCDCYLGVMPRFMKQMIHNDSGSLQEG